MKNSHFTERQKERLYLEAVNKWGARAQINMAYEEMGELISAINKLSRKRITIDDLITEIADVQIMVEQLAYIFGPSAVFAEKERKLLRLKERLNEEF